MDINPTSLHTVLESPTPVPAIQLDEECRKHKMRLISVVPANGKFYYYFEKRPSLVIEFDDRLSNEQIMQTFQAISEYLSKLGGLLSSRQAGGVQ